MPDASFEQAWSVAKAPLWTESGTTADYEPEKLDYANPQWETVPSMTTTPTMYRGSRPRWWESKHKDARGFASLQEGDAPDDPIDDYHQLSLFEIARDARGKGLMRDRLQEMIAELKEHDPEARSTHVTHSERKTAALWDKLVDEGLLNSASTKPYVTTTPEGRLIPHTKRRQG
jgi:hypothetical protein